MFRVCVHWRPYSYLLSSLLVALERRCWDYLLLQPLAKVQGPEVAYLPLLEVTKLLCAHLAVEEWSKL